MDLPYDPERSLGFLMNDVTRLMRRSFNRRAQALGLTQAQWRAIAQLSRHEGIRQAALADILEVQPITLGRLIDRLQEAGLVERRADPTDRRAVQLYLTTKAEPVVQQICTFAREVQEQAMAGLSEERRDALLDALKHLKSHLSEAEAEFRTAVNQ